MAEPAFPVVAGTGAGLVLAAVVRPGQDEVQWAGDVTGQVCQETAGLGGGEGGKACAFGAWAAMAAR